VTVRFASVISGHLSVDVGYSTSTDDQCAKAPNWDTLLGHCLGLEFIMLSWG